MVDYSKALSIQELINILEAQKDKTQKVCLEVYPEWDDCTFTLPVTKDMIWSDFLVFEMYGDKSGHCLAINGECQTDWFDKDEEDED